MTMTDESVVIYDETTPPYKFEPMSLTILPDISFDEWRELWGTVENIKRNHLWYVGDALRFGEEFFGEEYADVIGEYAAKTVGNAARVAACFPPERRREELTFSHHRALSAQSLSPEQRDALIQRAIDEQLGSKELEQIVRSMRQPSAGASYPSNNPPSLNGGTDPEDNLGSNEDEEDQTPRGVADPRLPDWLERNREVVGLVKANNGKSGAALSLPEQRPASLQDELRDLIDRLRSVATRSPLGPQERWDTKISQIPAPENQPKQFVVEMRRPPDHVAVGMTDRQLGFALAEAALTTIFTDLTESVI